MCTAKLLFQLISCFPFLSLLEIGVAVVYQKQKCVCLLHLLHPNKDRKLTNPRPAPPPCCYLSFCMSPSPPPPCSVLFTVFTYHLHLSKKPFKLFEVESRAAVGGAAAGSLPEPEHSVQHLRDMDTGA